MIKLSYKFLFLLLATFLAVCSTLSILIFFTMPNEPISLYPSIAELPVKYIWIILIGGIGKDFFLGWLTCEYYVSWKKRTLFTGEKIL